MRLNLLGIEGGIVYLSLSTARLQASTLPNLASYGENAGLIIGGMLGCIGGRKEGIPPLMIEAAFGYAKGALA